VLDLRMDGAALLAIGSILWFGFHGLPVSGSLGAGAGF
jgi:hypothetical protein